MRRLDCPLGRLSPPYATWWRTDYHPCFGSGRAPPTPTGDRRPQASEASATATPYLWASGPEEDDCAANPNALALHVGYELDSMVQMALRIGTNTDAVIENALVEATLLHGRNLIIFLVGPYRGDDITPDDLQPGGSPRWRESRKVGKVLGDCRYGTLDQGSHHRRQAMRVPRAGDDRAPVH